MQRLHWAWEVESPSWRLQNMQKAWPQKEAERHSGQGHPRGGEQPPKRPKPPMPVSPQACGLPLKSVADGCAGAEPGALSPSSEAEAVGLLPPRWQTPHPHAWHQWNHRLHTHQPNCREACPSYRRQPNHHYANLMRTIRGELLNTRSCSLRVLCFAAGTIR